MRRPKLQRATIRAEDVGVRYEVYQAGSGEGRFRRRSAIVVEALRGVSFELFDGDALGVVGNNGAGKSTLIQVLSGAVVPTSGSVGVSASPQRLSVSWALNPAMSGRRNAYLGLLAQGVEMAEARDLVDDVIAASYLGDAIERPMRTYSSGMRSRLGFAIATVKTPEILLLDEALSVGDKRFRARSLERVQAIRDDAGTVVIATHNLQEIEETCNKAMWLHDGQVIVVGEPEDVLGAYRRSGSLEHEANMERLERRKRQKRQPRQARQQRKEERSERDPGASAKRKQARSSRDRSAKAPRRPKADDQRGRS
jgi:teichoic acid transport system ATP-binding protein